MMQGDGRIPVVVGEPGRARDGDRVVRGENLGARAGHMPGCACCRPRGALAEALGRLFLEYARAATPPFSRVLVDLPDADAAAQVARAIEGDVLARARYRFAGRA